MIGTDTTFVSSTVSAVLDKICRLFPHFNLSEEIDIFCTMKLFIQHLTMNKNVATKMIPKLL